MSKIKSARKNANLTQKGMSDLLGIPVRTIQRWESGERAPSAWLEKLIVEKLSAIRESAGE